MSSPIITVRNTLVTITFSPPEPIIRDVTASIHTVVSQSSQENKALKFPEDIEIYIPELIDESESIYEPEILDEKQEYNIKSQLHVDVRSKANSNEKASDLIKQEKAKPLKTMALISEVILLANFLIEKKSHQRLAEDQWKIFKNEAELKDIRWLSIGTVKRVLNHVVICPKSSATAIREAQNIYKKLFSNNSGVVNQTCELCWNAKAITLPTSQKKKITEIFEDHQSYAIPAIVEDENLADEMELENFLNDLV